MRVCSKDLFSVDLEDKTEYSVSCGMLRSEVDCRAGAKQDVEYHRDRMGDEQEIERKREPIQTISHPVFPTPPQPSIPSKTRDLERKTVD